MIHTAIQSNNNIKKKEHMRLKKYQGLKEKLENILEVKVTVVPVVF